MMKKLSFVSLFLGCGLAVSACTSWVVTPEKSASGRMILHKSRDQHVLPVDAHMMVTKKGARWMNIGSAGGATFQMNEHGVALTSNSGDSHMGKHKKLAKKLPPFNETFADTIKDAAAAAEMVRDYGRAGWRAKGGMYLVADAKRAFTIEVASGYGEMMEIPGWIYVISNSMHLGGCEGFMERPFTNFCSHRAREANTRAELQRTQVDGKYTVAGILKTSRLSGGPTPFNRFSLSAVCFEVDPEFPEMIGCAYIALGPQQHTVYIPTPMALEQFPEDMQSGKWAARAFALRMKVGDDHQYLPRIEALEAEFLAEFDAVREAARKLLREGKRDEAKKLLNDTFTSHYTRAKELLKRIAEAAGVEPDPPILKREDEKKYMKILADKAPKPEAQPKKPENKDK